jgi:hypothetical protein
MEISNVMRAANSKDEERFGMDSYIEGLEQGLFKQRSNEKENCTQF